MTAGLLPAAAALSAASVDTGCGVALPPPLVPLPFAAQPTSVPGSGGVVQFAPPAPAVPVVPPVPAVALPAAPPRPPVPVPPAPVPAEAPVPPAPIVPAPPVVPDAPPVPVAPPTAPPAPDPGSVDDVEHAFARRTANAKVVGRRTKAGRMRMNATATSRRSRKSPVN